LYVFFWVFPRRQIEFCRRFGTLCQVHLQRHLLIISYVRNKVVYCCWVSIYALINDKILFIYLFIISTSGGTPRKCPRYPGTPVGKHWSTLFRRCWPDPVTALHTIRSHCPPRSPLPMLHLT
jgi:hypothetical protein